MSEPHDFYRRNPDYQGEPILAANPAPAGLDACGRLCIHVDDCPVHGRTA